MNAEQCAPLKTRVPPQQLTGLGLVDLVVVVAIVFQRVGHSLCSAGRQGTVSGLREQRAPGAKTGWARDLEALDEVGVAEARVEEPAVQYGRAGETALRGGLLHACAAARVHERPYRAELQKTRGQKTCPLVGRARAAAEQHTLAPHAHRSACSHVRRPFRSWSTASRVAPARGASDGQSWISTDSRRERLFEFISFSE